MFVQPDPFVNQELLIGPVKNQDARGWASASLVLGASSKLVAPTKMCILNVA